MLQQEFLPQIGTAFNTWFIISVVFWIGDWAKLSEAPLLHLTWVVCVLNAPAFYSVSESIKRHLLNVTSRPLEIEVGFVQCNQYLEFVICQDFVTLNWWLVVLYYIVTLNKMKLRQLRCSFQCISWCTVYFFY